MDWLIKLFPEGFRVEPNTNIYKFLFVVNKELEEVKSYIESGTDFIPKEGSTQLEGWEEMMDIETSANAQQRVINIRNKLIGEHGLFNKELFKKTLALFTGGNFTDDDFDVQHGIPFRVGHSVCGDRLADENSVFGILLTLKKEVLDRPGLEEEIEKIRHAHIFLKIRYE